MTLQKKMEGSKWKKCTYCDCIFVTQDGEIHKTVCNTTIGDDRFLQTFYPSSESVKHNFIKNSRYFGSCTRITSEEFLGGTKLQRNCDDFIVMLPLSVMKFCSISIGSWVLLTNSAGEQIVRTVYPNERLRNEIGVQEQTCCRFGVKLRDYISVETYTGPKMPAEEIVLTPKHDTLTASMLSPRVVEVLKTRENGTFLCTGNRLSLRYLGHTFEFSVANVAGKNNEGPSSLEFNCEVNNSERTSWATSTPIKSSAPTMNRKEFYYVTTDTEIKIENTDHSPSEKSSWSYSMIGGLDEEISLIQKLVDQYKSKSFPIGILINGPSGVGKSALVQAVVAENKSHHFLTVSKPNEILKTDSEVERVFEDARKKSPSILLIENIEEWCPKRSDVINIQDLQLASTLKMEINKIQSGDFATIVFATTRDVTELDQTLRRSLYFDVEIELSVPTVEQKTEILKRVAMPFKHALTHSDMFELAKLSHGYTGSTLKRLIVKAYLGKIQSSSGVSADIQLEFEDLKCTMKDIVPDVMDGFNHDLNEVLWSDVAGYEDVKEKLIQAVEWPLKYPDDFKRLGVSPTKGILLYGPSGCGKSMLAEAVGTESKFNFIYVTSNDVSIKFVGKSEEAIRNLFRAAKRAAPCIVFIDKIDCLATVRGELGSGGRVENRVLGQLLKAMEEVRSEMVIVIGATTSPQLVDEALLRPGRLDRKIHVPLPDSETRRQLFNICLKNENVTDDVVNEDLIRRTEGYSGADIKGLCCSAIREALQENKLSESYVVSMEHFTRALKNSTSSCLDYEIEMCQLFQKSQIK